MKVFEFKMTFEICILKKRGTGQPVPLFFKKRKIILIQIQL
jgi:hypothetical protein